jgi:hypothetical protein
MKSPNHGHTINEYAATCILNAPNERYDNFENFGTRIAKIGVAVEKIW